MKLRKLMRLFVPNYTLKLNSIGMGSSHFKPSIEILVFDPVDSGFDLKKGFRGW